MRGLSTLPSGRAVGAHASGIATATRIASGVAIAALAGLGCRGPSPTPTAIPSPTPPPTAPPLGRTELPLGVQLFEDDVTTPALEHLRQAGVAWARVRALWKLVEAREGSYDWTVTDRLFGDAAAAGFRMVAVVYANPPWVSDGECLPVPEAHLPRYQAFWQALVERYDGDGRDDAPGGTEVHYWQVSNEPDFDPHAAGAEGDYGGCFGDVPERYAAQLVTAYRAAKAADAAAQVGFGPVAWDRFTAESQPPGWTAPPGPYVHDFTQRAFEALYRTSAGAPELPFADFIGLHHYPDQAHYWDRGLQQELVARAAAFRESQLALPGVYDLRRLPLLISETSMAAGPTDEWTERSEALQAVYVGQTMVRALAAGAMAAIWYTARDNLVGDCLPPHHDWLRFGLMRADDYLDALRQRCPRQDWVDAAAYTLDSGATPRPALQALAALTKALRGYSFERQLGPAEGAGPDLEAYLFRGAGGRSLVAAWATDGRRLGAVGAAPPTARLRIGAAALAPWTGRVRLTEHLGAVSLLGRRGAPDLELGLSAAPVYLETAAEGEGAGAP